MSDNDDNDYETKMSKKYNIIIRDKSQTFVRAIDSEVRKVWWCVLEEGRKGRMGICTNKSVSNPRRRTSHENLSDFDSEDCLNILFIFFTFTPCSVFLQFFSSIIGLATTVH